MHARKDSSNSVVRQNVPRNGDIDSADREHLHTLSPELALDPGIWEVEERNDGAAVIKLGIMQNLQRLRV